MTDVQAIAEQLLQELTPSERVELLERLLTPGRSTAALSPRDAGIVCSAGMSAVTRSVNRGRPSGADLDELGEALFYGLDSFCRALEVASHFAEGSRGHGPAGQWERASFDALNLRDRVSAAVRDSYNWEDSYPSHVDQ